MSDEPPRLSTTARSALARHLIASADVDRSDVDAKDRALASIGLGTAFAAGVGTEEFELECRRDVQGMLELGATSPRQGVLRYLPRRR